MAKSKAEKIVDQDLLSKVVVNVISGAGGACAGVTVYYVVDAVLPVPDGIPKKVILGTGSYLIGREVQRKVKNSIREDMMNGAAFVLSGKSIMRAFGLWPD